MQDKDAKKQSMFQVAGRVFYEANVFGYRVTSFTNSGFLEDKFYQIPPISSSKIEFAKEHLLEIGAGLLVLGLLCILFGKTTPKTS